MKTDKAREILNSIIFDLVKQPVSGQEERIDQALTSLYELVMQNVGVVLIGTTI